METSMLYPDCMHVNLLNEQAVSCKKQNSSYFKSNEQRTFVTLPVGKRQSLTTQRCWLFSSTGLTRHNPSEYCHPKKARLCWKRFIHSNASLKEGLCSCFAFRDKLLYNLIGYGGEKHKLMFYICHQVCSLSHVMLYL